MLPFAGAVADRLGRRRVMLSADVLRCAAQASLAAALFAGRPALWLFVLLAWLEGTGEAFFSPALDALTVEVSPPDQLGNANAMYGLAASAARIAGPALGGILVALAGPAVVVAADAASFGASVLALGLLRMPGAAKTAGAARQGRRSLLGDMAEGWAEFRSRTWLWVVTVQFAFFNLITWAPWMLLGPVMGRAYLGGAAVWGAIMAVQGAGAIAAGLGSLGRKPTAAHGHRHHRHVLLRAARHPDGPARDRPVGSRSRLRLRRGRGAVQHLLRHGPAAAGSARHAGQGQFADPLPRLRRRRDRIRDRRPAGRAVRGIGGVRRRGRLRAAEQRGRPGAPGRPRPALDRVARVSVSWRQPAGRRTRPAGRRP